MRWPLRRQILLPMVGILLVTVGAVSALNAWLASQRVQRQLDVQLADVAQTLSASNFPLEASVLRQTRGLTGAQYVVQAHDGAALAASDDAFLAAADPARPADSRWDWQRRIAAGGQSHFHAVVPLDRRPVGGERLRLHVFYPVATWREARWQAVWPPLAIGLAAVALVAAAAYAVASHVTQPIHQLQQQVERIAGGDFRTLPVPQRDDEIRDLAAAVNQMAQRLADYEADARQSERLRTLATLGAGIAHQIRNAATGCRIALDLHQRDCRAADATATAHDDPSGEPLDIAIRQLAQIETYIQRLLTLGRPSATPQEDVDLADIVAKAVDLTGPNARHLGVKIQLVCETNSLVVRGDAAALVQMAVNLLTNAIEATAHCHAVAAHAASLRDGDVIGANSAEAVIVRLTAAGDVAELAVGDVGPGPSPAIQSRLFEPFATDKPGGTGLGLVVARQVAADHGGTIRWSRTGGRTWFFVQIPLRRQSLNAAGSATNTKAAQQPMPEGQKRG